VWCQFQENENDSKIQTSVVMKSCAIVTTHKNIIRQIKPSSSWQKASDYSCINKTISSRTTDLIISSS
jgi:hypothetical protein